MKTFACLLALFSLAVAVPQGFAAHQNNTNQIVSVNAKDHTVTISKGAKETVTYTVKDSTRILIDNKTGEFAGLKVGMKASVNHQSGSTQADSIFAQDIVKPKGRKGGGKHK